MRRARIKAEGAGYYHCMSRVIEARRIFGQAEKRQFLGLMRSLAEFGGLQVLTYCLMGNHFHILLHVPERQELSDEAWLGRLACILPPQQLHLISQQLQDYRRQGQAQAALKLRARYTYRMNDISEFFKALKQRFSQAYNKREGRHGPLWEQRFKSVLLEGSAQTLLTVAAYIELNPVRAGICNDPKDYLYSGYGAAMGGSAPAREGLQQLLAGAGRRMSWRKAQRQYRQHLYIQGREKGQDPQGRALRRGFTDEQVQEVLEKEGRLPMQELLRCRVRYFSDGLALGSEAFVDEVFKRHHRQFGPKRRKGALPMRGGEWGGLRTLRALRLCPVSRG